MPLLPLWRPPPWMHKPKAAGRPSGAHQLPWRAKLVPTAPDWASALHYHHHPVFFFFHCSSVMLAPTAPPPAVPKPQQRPVTLYHPKDCHRNYSPSNRLLKTRHAEAGRSASTNECGCCRQEERIADETWRPELGGVNNDRMELPPQNENMTRERSSLTKTQESYQIKRAFSKLLFWG